MIKRPLSFIACLFLIVMILLMKLHPIRGNPPDLPEGSLITVTGRVRDRQYKNNSYILILSDAVPENGDSVKTSLLVYLEKEPVAFNLSPPIGSSVKVRGKLSLFQEATNPGQFDMRDYYHIRGIDYRLFNACILSHGKRYDIMREELFRLRSRIGRVYDSLLPEDDSGVLKAMILGDKNSLDPDIKTLYRNSGIAHALAISGLHISILGYGLYRILKKAGLHPLPGSLFCICFISLYSIMVGGSTSTIRAVIMFAACLLADITGRTYDLLSALSLSLMMILFTDPLYIYDSGFMLSFGAVMGIALISPFLKHCLPFGDKPFLSGFIASISVTLFTLPVTLYFFYEIPSYGVILNLMIIPLMGILVVSAVLTAFAGMILPAFGIPSAFICHMILTAYERGCLICQNLPGSMITPGRPEIWRIIIYYPLLITLCILFGHARPSSGHTRKRRKYILFLPLILLMVLPLILTIRVHRGLTYTMLDIGQGDCNVITVGTGKTLMIDCGSSSEKEIGRYIVIPFLKYNGINTVDTVILTHADSDHINGFEEMLNMNDPEGIRIRNLIIPGEKNMNDKFIRLKTLAENKGIRCLTFNSGDRIKTGMAELECLSPEKGFSAEDENEYSIVLKLTFGSFIGLFTGDIQGNAEEKLISKTGGNSGITLLKVAHHGSRYSTPSKFLNKIKPRYSLISAGRHNKYHHPHKELLTRLREVGTTIHSTAEEGAITVKTNGTKIKITGEKNEKD